MSDPKLPVHSDVAAHASGTSRLHVELVSYTHEYCDGSDDDDIVPSNPDLLTQIDDILQPCLSCHPHRLLTDSYRHFLHYFMRLAHLSYIMHGHMGLVV